MVPQLRQSAGDSFPSDCKAIEVHVAELKQLFNAIDPSPFREKDLDPNAEQFIVGWAGDLPRDAPPGLARHFDARGMAEEPGFCEASESSQTARRASRQRLRQLPRGGPAWIGLAFLVVSFLIGDVSAKVLGEGRIGELLRESLLIGGWVAMWRPLQIFLYDWWPIRAEARLFDRLSAMPVRIAYTKDATSEAWRWDWPAFAPAFCGSRIAARRPVGAAGRDPST
jgi:hypothetical protein